jgi:protein SCO1/2
MRVSAAVLLCVMPCFAAQRYPVSGIVLATDPAHKTFTASISAIPGYMAPMTMPFKVRTAGELANTTAGARIDFTLVVDGKSSWAENIQPHRFESTEQDPLRARRLQLLEGSGNTLKRGEPVPDFTLTDQTGRPVRLSQFAGKVVAVTFIYTSCPLPDYCFRLSNNFGRLNRRFSKRMGKDLILLSITFDPTHDTPEVLARYAQTWKADPASWSFLTGPLADIKAVCRGFGMNFWQDEGYLTHSLHTAVIDRTGKLAANFEGNDFTAEQLGDFIESVLRDGAIR